MCPDIVETKLLNQREREWRPDPQVINKWTVLYNLQKDYMSRILPQIQAMKNYDDGMHDKLIKEKVEKQNLANLIQFQNKVNADLAKGSSDYKFDTEKNCDDNGLKFAHNQVVGPEKPHLSDFNKLLVSQLKNGKDFDLTITKNLDPSNRSILEASMKNFINNQNGFNFKEAPEKRADLTNSLPTNDSATKIPQSNLINENLVKLDLKDDAIKSNVNFNKLMSNINLKDGEKIEYLGTSVGTPYAGLEKEKEVSITKEKEEIGKPTISKVTFAAKKEEKKVNDIKANIQKNQKSKKPEKVEEKAEPKVEKKVEVKTDKKTEEQPILIQTNEHVSKFENDEEAILDNYVNENDFGILNPPMMTSFIEAEQSVQIEKNVFENMVSKSNFNMETQRRGRRRSRFPDPQWDCAEAQIAKLVRYLCAEELSSNYQKYCKPIFEQINTMIESYLYHDNHLEICQNIHMCPVTVDI
jgi:hypothetical protein